MDAGADTLSGREAADALAAELSAERKVLPPEDLHLFETPRLLRVLEANSWSRQMAAAQFRKMLAQRRRAGLEANGFGLGSAPWSLDSLPGMRDFLKELRVEADCFTLDGHMIWAQSMKRVDLTKIREMPEAEMLNTLELVMELRGSCLDRMSVQKGRLLKVIDVLDMTGLSVVSLMRDGRILARLGKLINFSTVAHPETRLKTFVLNPPSSFSALMTWASPLLNARMKGKIKVCHGDNIAAVLAEYAGPQALDALARARMDVCPGATVLRLDVGEICHASAWVKPGDLATWSFQVFPESMHVGFSVQFFGLESSMRTVSRRTQVSGSVSGSMRAREAGLIWFTWSNKHSWATKKRVGNLRLPTSADREETLSLCSAQRVAEMTRRNLQVQQVQSTLPLGCYAFLATQKKRTCVSDVLDVEDETLCEEDEETKGKVSHDFSSAWEMALYVLAIFTSIFFMFPTRRLSTLLCMWPTDIPGVSSFKRGSLWESLCVLTSWCRVSGEQPQRGQHRRAPMR